MSNRPSKCQGWTLNCSPCLRPAPSSVSSLFQQLTLFQLPGLNSDLLVSTLPIQYIEKCFVSTITEYLGLLSTVSTASALGLCSLSCQGFICSKSYSGSPFLSVKPWFLGICPQMPLAASPGDFPGGHFIPAAPPPCLSDRPYVPLLWAFSVTFPLPGMLWTAVYVSQIYPQCSIKQNLLPPCILLY